jgi:CrcB protein
VLGGFTTFSAFGVDTIFLLRRGETVVAFGYVAATLLCGFVALWLAMKAVPHQPRL